jgi:hypothetical protein
MIIPKGALFTVTFVEHKDHNTMTVCIALVDINIYDIQVEYLSEYPTQKREFNFDETQFLNWITNIKHYAEDIAEEKYFYDLYLGEDHTISLEVLE